jgi:putative flippase GtrA
METRRQGVLFVLVGAWNTVFGFATFAVLHALLGDHVHYMVVLILSWCLSILQNFVTYRHFVFKVEGHWWRDLARFSVVYAGLFGFNIVALPVAVSVFDAPVIPAQAVIVVITVISSFFAHRNFSFRRPHASEPVG